MNDNYDYEEELFDSESDDQKTRKKEEKSGMNQDKLVRVLLITVIFALIAVVVLITLLLGSRENGDSQTDDPQSGNQAVAGETTTLQTGTVVGQTGEYAPGKYTVNVGENAYLTLREDAAKTSEAIFRIPHGTLLTITEIVYNAAAEEDFQYWGRTEYLGRDAWVSMKYLAKAYPENSDPSENVPTSAPAEETTEAVTDSAEPSEAPTTEAPAENVYVVVVDGGGSLNMRTEPDSASAKAIENGIPSGTKVTVLEIYENPEATDARVKYWAKVTYNNVTGWVAMGYLEKQ